MISHFFTRPFFNAIKNAPARFHTADNGKTGDARVFQILDPVEG